jgi:thiol-disulfide isomerase/thioredoxin
MRVDSYILVFGVVGALVLAAGLSVLVSPQDSLPTSLPADLSTRSASGPPDLGKAPNFQGIVGWINSPPLDLSQLRGKVVLVHFWTYSCINCIHTIPYINGWYSKYRNDGLVVVGVHTPEFQFEKNYTNVAAAVKSDGIEYPIALDSNSATWNAYKNQYWPADYVIDKSGNIRGVHFGEGDYNATETLIQALLKEAGYTIPQEDALNGAIGTGASLSQVRMTEKHSLSLQTGFTNLIGPAWASPHRSAMTF